MIHQLSLTYKEYLPKVKKECDICIIREHIFAPNDGVNYDAVKDEIVYRANMDIWNAVISISHVGGLIKECKRLLQKMVENDNAN